MRLKIFLIIGVIFLFCIFLFPSRGYALTMYVSGHNMDSQAQATNSLTSFSQGGAVRLNCDYCALPPYFGAIFCYVLCWSFGSPLVNETACFDNQPLWLDSYGGATGVAYFNNTCDTGFPEYQHFAVRPRNNQGGITFTTPPDKPTTMYAQVKVRVPSWTGYNGTIEPASLLFYDHQTNTFLPAVKNLTTSTDWQLLTIWHTFPPNSEFSVILNAGEYHNMNSGWRMYIDFFRVGFVDKEIFVSEEPNSTQKWEDCGYATGWHGNGCGWSGYLFDNETNETIRLSISAMNLGGDSGEDLFCQTWYSNYTTKEGFNGTYVVRMPMEMQPFNYSSKTGSFYDSYSTEVSGGIFRADWCYLLAKDYFYHSSWSKVTNIRYFIGDCWSTKYNRGFFDILSPNEIRYTSLGHQDYRYKPFCEGGDAYPYWMCGVNYPWDSTSGDCDADDCGTSGGTRGSDLGGGIGFGTNFSGGGGGFSVYNVSMESQDLIWIRADPPWGTGCPDCCIYDGDGTMYWRWRVPESYLSEWGISGDQWKVSDIGVGTNAELFSSWWLDGQYFFFGDTQPSMWNVTCDAGWVCEGNEEFYLNEECERFLITDCGFCGCLPTADRCRIGEDHWECHGLETWHYNESCLHDLELLCDVGCDNETGMCEGEVNCLTTDECEGLQYCNETTGWFYSDSFCNTTTYACDYMGTECTYGCAGYGCLGIPNEPVFTNQTPQAVISEVTGGILGFLSASGSGIFNILFLLFVIVFIISIFGLVAYFIKKGFSH